MILYTVTELDELLDNVNCRQDVLEIQWFVQAHNYPTCVKQAIEALIPIYKDLFDK